MRPQDCRSPDGLTVPPVASSCWRNTQHKNIRSKHTYHGIVWVVLLWKLCLECVCVAYMCVIVLLCVCVCVCVCVHVFYSSQHHSPLHEWLQMQGASHAGSHS